jgi:cation transport ATPase
MVGKHTLCPLLLPVKRLGERMFDCICFILEQVEDAQAREAPVQRLADSIAGPFVYTVMTLAAATFSFWCALFLFSFIQ